MKKLYIALFVLSIISVSKAQSPLNYTLAIDNDCSSLDKKEVFQQNNIKSKAVIWSEDFSSGFPAGWTIQDASGICPWVWSNDGSWGYFNGNSGASVGTAISSSSAANGFLICDPDSANNATYGQPSGSTYQYLDTYFTTSAIDLTGYPSVVLQFEQYFRYNNTIDMNVMVSNNNVTWTTYTVQGNSLNNTYSDNPDTVKINISAVAGNQATVYIKIGWDARVYFWQIDDIKISEAETNDLSITDHYFGSLDLPYYQIPNEQVTAIDFSANVLNNGAVDQPNTTLTIDVNTMFLFSGTSSPVNLAVGNSDSLSCTTQYTPSSSLGTRTLSWTVASDSIDDLISDNTASESIEITDYIYARDKDVITGSWGNSGEAYEIGNYFDINANQNLTYIDFIPSSNSNIGAVVYGVVYSIDQGNFIWEGNTDDYILTSNDVNNNSTISLPLFSPLSLTAGEGYLVCAGAYGDGGATNDFRVATSGTSDPQTSYKYDGTDLTWYYLTSTPMVRMNFDPSWGINDNTDLNIQLSQNNPNPFNDHTYIKFELMENKSARIEISDITGKIIEVISLDNLGIGIHEIELNSKNYNSGSYLYSLISGKHRTTKQMVIYK